MNRLQPQFGPWKLWNELHSEMNGLFGPRAISSDPHVNLWANENSVILGIDLPGREPDDVHVSVHRNQVTIDAKPRAEEAAEEATVLRQERNHARESRQIKLPFEVDAENVVAVYERGTLRIMLHRHQATLPTRITVTAGSSAAD